MTTPKRSLSPMDSEQPEAKRVRMGESAPDKDLLAYNYMGVAGTNDSRQEHQDSGITTPFVWESPTLHLQSRQALKRSIAIVLQHDGFASATPQALEGFTQIVETYLDSIIGEVKQFALSSRREYPIPLDFEKTLLRHNVPISSLKPHLKNPASIERLNPTYDSGVFSSPQDALATLPLLADELSGRPDKDSKLYIPTTFPDFPSKHTYKFTPQEDANIRDAKKIREQAARTAQQGEDALRRLVRASKMRKQKEVKSLVERDCHGKERFRLWELTMKRFMVADGRTENVDQVEIADHSMIVNSDAIYNRKEVSRSGKRPGALGS